MITNLHKTADNSRTMLEMTLKDFIHGRINFMHSLSLTHPDLFNELRRDSGKIATIKNTIKSLK